MNKQQKKTLLIGGGIAAGLGVVAYALSRQQTQTQTETQLLNGGYGGGSSAMDEIAGGTDFTQLTDFIGGLQNQNADAMNNYLSALNWEQPSDEQADGITTQSIYGDKFIESKNVYDALTTSETGNYNFRGYTNLNDAIRAGDSDAIQAFGQAAADAARAVYGNGYNALTPAQQSALVSNISHGRIDTADVTPEARQGGTLQSLNNSDVYDAALKRTAGGTYASGGGGSSGGSSKAGTSTGGSSGGGGGTYVAPSTPSTPSTPKVVANIQPSYSYQPFSLGNIGKTISGAIGGFFGGLFK